MYKKEVEHYGEHPGVLWYLVYIVSCILFVHDGRISFYNRKASVSLDSLP